MLHLDFTGHPYFDIGLAAITAHAEKDRPADLEEDDLHEAAKFIELYYTEQPLVSFLTVCFPNAGFTNPAYSKSPEQRHAYARIVANSFSSDMPASDEVCVFTGEPALGLPLSLKSDIPPGRAYRQHIPLLTGEGVINFLPGGDPGLPVSGKALLCLQFFPMGCRKCGGRLLAVHSDNPEILMAVAREALLENKQGISLARATGETKLPDASPSAQTLIVQTLVSMDQRRFYAREDMQPYSVTAYHLSNSGQSSPLDKTPLLQIYHLPMDIVRFLGKMYQPDYKSTWNALVARGKPRPKVTKDKQAAAKSGTQEVKKKESGPYYARNYFYEDILRLPDEARRFVRRYFLRIPELHTPQASVAPLENSEGLQKERDVVPWSFIALFLKEVLDVEKKRIDEIGKLGERLAAYVKEFDDKRFFGKFYELQRADYFRSELLRAAKNAASRGKSPLFRYEEFCTVFFELNGEDLRMDWRLARDLVFIRMLEWLYDHDDKLQEHVGALTQERDTENGNSNDE